MIKYKVYGTSHSKVMGVRIYGLKEGYQIDIPSLCVELKHRQQGYGRSARQSMEKNEIIVKRGIKKGKSDGGVLELFVKNGDGRFKEKPPITALRSGHADFAGCVKFDMLDARKAAELASGRNTLPHVLAGAVAKQILSEKGITFLSYASSIGGIGAKRQEYTKEEIENSLLRFPDSQKEARVVALIDKARQEGDTLGGVARVECRGLPAGLGEIYNYEKRLDALIFYKLAAIPSVKGVEIGEAFELCSLSGAQAADYFKVEGGNISYATNNCGGITGGLSTGAPVVINLAVKPIPSVKGLLTYDIVTRQPCYSHFERSDTCVVGNIGVIAENMLAMLILQVIEREGRL